MTERVKLTLVGLGKQPVGGETHVDNYTSGLDGHVVPFLSACRGEFGGSGSDVGPQLAFTFGELQLLLLNLQERNAILESVARRKQKRCAGPRIHLH